MTEFTTWVNTHLYDMMIPVCLLCLFRILMCCLQTGRTKKLRQQLHFHSVRAFYAEIGCWVGVFIGSVLCCLLPGLWLPCMALAIVLGVIGFRLGKKKGLAEDDYWREKGKKLIAEAKERGEYEEREIKTHGAGAIIQAIGDDTKHIIPHEDTKKENEE